MCWAGMGMISCPHAATQLSSWGMVLDRWQWKRRTWQDEGGRKDWGGVGLEDSQRSVESDSMLKYRLVEF